MFLVIIIWSTYIRLEILTLMSRFMNNKVFALAFLKPNSRMNQLGAWYPKYGD